jgi:fused signal recognition particle receptor
MVATLGSEAAPPSASPHVVLVLGVNGVGKTTTIAKLAHRAKEAGRSVLLVAGDTFRAAAIDQLIVWAKRLGCDVVAQAPGADAASVAFDGVERAKARGYDVVIVDTAGRLHTKRHLMEELKKVTRVVDRALPGAPHEKLLVIDATVGANGLAQAREFHQAVGLTGVVVTKLDGTAKGGVVLAVAGELKLPITHVGVGEKMEDLKPFDAREFVNSILGS